jgi:hypothetical protein
VFDHHLQRLEQESPYDKRTAFRGGGLLLLVVLAGERPHLRFDKLHRHLSVWSGDLLGRTIGLTEDPETVDAHAVGSFERWLTRDRRAALRRAGTVYLHVGLRCRRLKEDTGS